MTQSKRILQSYLIGWFIANLVWFVLRSDGDQSNDEGLTTELITFIITWFTQGFGYGVINIIVNRYINKRVSFKKLMAISLVLQLMVAFLLSIVIFYLFHRLQIQNIPSSVTQFISMPVITMAIFYAFITNFTITLFNQINRMLGKGNLVKIASGQYYKPIEDRRILMFLDLRGSTTIAEKLGHHKYSQLIQDCFYDLAIVDSYQANVYKYVGDEAILEWKSIAGKKSMNCLKSFFVFQDKINSRSEYYNKSYGLVPQFKAGMHIGNVIIAEIGEIKREIALNGDTMNTAARIEGECNRLNADFLISDDLLSFLELESWVTPVLKGEIQLKGKEKTTKIYAIDKV